VRRTLFLVGCAIMGIALGVARVPRQASGHLESTYYKHWAQDEIWNIGYLQAELNNSTAINTINRSPGPWNSVSGSFHDFLYYGGRDANRVWTGSACTTSGGNVWVISHAISPLGITQYCIEGGILTRSVILVDVRTDWDIDGGTTDFNQVDLQGLVTHEFGHATGFGAGQGLDHFIDSDTACNPGMATMCDSLGKGQVHWRTLTDHDQHTYRQFYD
jgi:hypothetical protein